METPVRFSYGSDEVHGIVHAPADTSAPAARVGVLFMNPGLRPRSGPQRQYARLARRLCADGFHVLRVDLPGVGDSQGRLTEVLEYRRLAGDPQRATRAIEFFREQTGVETVGLAGLCTGAYTALASGHAHEQVDFGLLFGLPVSAVGDGVKVARQAPAEGRLRRVARRALQFRRWLDPTLFRSNVDALRRFFGGITNPGRWQGYEDRGLWNKVEAFVTGKRVLFVFGERDHEYRAFLDQIDGRLERLRRRSRAHYALHVVPEGDHALSMLAWQDGAFAAAGRWLHEQVVGA